jgi:hypothetical protein
LRKREETLLSDLFRVGGITQYSSAHRINHAAMARDDFLKCPRITPFLPVFQ